MTILGTGLTGLIGSRIVELLDDTQFEHISRTEGIDVTNATKVNEAVGGSHADVVLHLAAYTDVKKAETEKDLGEQSESWQVNVIGTENLAKACREFGKRLVYISTDLVFDGEHTPQDGYKEDATPRPLNWYALTKYEGEKRVEEYTKDYAILRIAYPYRAAYTKLDFVRLFIEKLQKKEDLTVLSDRIITPTFVDDIAFAIKQVIEKKETGMFHVVGSESLSILDCAKEIAEVFSLDESHIHGVSRAEFLVGRPAEPFNSSLNNDKIRSLGVVMHTFKEGLEIIKQQL